MCTLCRPVDGCRYWFSGILYYSKCDLSKRMGKFHHNCNALQHWNPILVQLCYTRESFVDKFYFLFFVSFVVRCSLSSSSHSRWHFFLCHCITKTLMHMQLLQWCTPRLVYVSWWTSPHDWDLILKTNTTDCCIALCDRF